MGAAQLNDMLARSAHGLFWMSRYLERAEYTSRLLTVQFDALEDRAVREIDRNWRRIYLSLARSPVGGDLTDNSDDEDFMLMDSFTLADDLTFEPSNPDSIMSCMYYARENARQVRNVIGRQLWTRLNTAYLDLKNSGITVIWGNHTKNFYHETEDTARTMSGILESTAYRDHGWHFFQLGRYVERTQIIAALLDAQIQVFPTNRQDQGPDWNSLLLACNAQLAYRRRHSMLPTDPKKVLEFLICNASLSYSIRYSLDRTLEHLHEVSADRDELQFTEINQQVENVLQSVAQVSQSGFSTEPEMREFLANVLAQSRATSDAIAIAYFDYGLEN